MSFQDYSDAVVNRTFLPLIPESITPNALTGLRIIFSLVLFFLLLNDRYGIALGMFALAVLTDLLDGPLARTRNQISEIGKVIDPIADRLLTAVVVFVLIVPAAGWSPIFVWVTLEFVNAVMAYRSRVKIGYNPGANWAGKTKKWIQFVALTLLFCSIIFHAPYMLVLIWLLFLVSFAFTLLQAFLYL